MTAGAWAIQIWDSRDCHVMLDDNNVLTITGTGLMEDYAEVSATPWYNVKADIYSVVIKDGVRLIGDVVFQECTNLTSVSFGKDVKIIGESVFALCENLKSITIPASVWYISRGAFYGCSGMTDIYLYADPNRLVWYAAPFGDFKDNKATVCHVLPEYLDDYKSIFPEANVTFVGDLRPMGPSIMASQDEMLEWLFPMPSYDAEVSVDYFDPSNLSIDVNDTNAGSVVVDDLLKFEEFTTVSDPGNYSKNRYHFVGEHFQIDARSFDMDGIRLDGVEVKSLGYQTINKIDVTIGFLSNNWNTNYCYAYYTPKNKSKITMPRPYSKGLTKTADGINAHEVSFSGTAGYTIQFNKWKVYYSDSIIVENQDSSYTVKRPIDVTIEAQANEGWHVVGWKDRYGGEFTTATYGEGKNPTTSKLTLNIASDSRISVVAYFDTNAYNVSVNFNGEEGSVSGPDTVKHFASGTYTAIAKPCYYFVNWTDSEGNILGTEETISIAAISDTSITAHFAKSTYAGDTTAEACDKFVWHDIIYSETPAEAPTFVYKTVDGCDSTVTLHLTMHYSSVGDTSADVCDRFTWYDETYTQTPSFAPIHVMTNAEGCDSTVTLLLTVRYSTTSDTTAKACDRFVWHDISYNSTPLMPPTYVTTNAEGCDSTVTLWLTINHSSMDDTFAKACERFTWHDSTYTATPAVAPTYVMTNSYGCDSTVILWLTINYNTIGDTYATACDKFAWHDSIYTSTPIVDPIHVLPNVKGCDSTVTLRLTVNHSTVGDTSANVCDSLTWRGVTYTETPAVAPTYGLTNAKGCDSIVTLNLTIRHSTVSGIIMNACDSLAWHDSTYTVTPAEVQTYDTINAAGCDSTVTLMLFVRHSTTGDTTAKACERFTWHDSTYTATPAEVPSYVTTNAEGCDSTVVLWLTINYNTLSDTHATACDQFAWHDSTYTSTPIVVPLHVLPNAKGCDSLVTLWLTVNHSTVGDTSADVCDSLTWHGVTYTEKPAVAPTYGLTNAKGCDSTVTLNLSIRYSTTGDTTAEACDQFAWHGTNYTATPLVAPTYVMTNAEGCDSTVTLLLTIRHSTTGDTTATACDQFAWHDSTYTATPAEAPTYVTTNAAGCDSTVILSLNIYYTTSDTTATACDEFTWHGITYTETPAEAPTYFFDNATGCDSTVTLHLTIHYSNSGVETVTACDKYEWQGTIYTESNTTDQRTLVNKDECDSVVTLNLTLNYHHDTTLYYQTSGDFDFLGVTYTESGTYPRVIETTQGCDSNISLVLAYLPLTTPLPTIYNIMGVTLFINHFPEGSDKIDYIYYRWYRNGEVVSEGENMDSYSEEGNTLNGCFYLEISTESTHTYWAKSNEVCIGNLGINDVESVTMTVSPNPVVRGQRVNVTVSEANMQDAVVTLYDAQGRQVSNIEAKNSNFEIQTSNLTSGIYTVRIMLADGRMAIKKIVVK